MYKVVTYTHWDRALVMSGEISPIMTYCILIFFFVALERHVHTHAVYADASFLLNIL